MLIVNQLNGFGGRRSSRGPAVLIDRTAGTNIGDMIDSAGLAAAFDGVTNQAVVSSAAKTASLNAYVGKTVAAPTAIESSTVFGSNNNGFASTNPSCTITLYGKQGAAPSSRTDGTVLGSITFTDTSNESAGRTINSSDTATYWDHVWVGIVVGAGVFVICAELQLTGWQ